MMELWINGRDLLPDTDGITPTASCGAVSEIRRERERTMELFHRIIVTSCKGGIGKSTVSLGVAAALARRGSRVLLVDCDVGNRCLDLMLGVQDQVLYDWGDVGACRCGAEDALLSLPETDNFFFCAAPEEAPDARSTADALSALAERARAEYVLCDTAGSGETVRAIASRFADGALVVSTQQPAAIRSAERTAALMQETGGLPCRLVISCFEENAAAEGERAGLIEIIDRTHIRTIGVVPKDRTLLLSQEAGRLPDPRSRAGAAFSNIAGRLTGENIRLFRGIRKIRTRRVL